MAGQATPLFKPASLRAVVRASARELEIRNTAWMVLGELLRCVNYRSGTARISTPLICENIGRSERAVKTGLQQLRDAGVIYWVGRAGRGRTALYAFGYTLEAVKAHNATCKRGAEFAPLSVGGYITKGCNSFPKGVQNLPERGANFAPPSPSVNKYQQEGREKAPASRGAGPDDAVGVCPVRPWDGKEPYGHYLDRVKAREREALRAAENG